MKYFLSILGIVLVIFIVNFVNNSPSKVRSVAEGQGYYSTTTYAWNGTPLINGGQRSLKFNSSGDLGSVDITGGAVAGQVIFYDATSTTDVSSTTLLVIPASAAAMTHNYDITFKRGLVISTVAGLVPTSTITWR